MHKRKKGALTLEAAVVLPVYIFSMLTLAYMIQTYYIHTTIDAVTAQVMLDIAGKTFYLDQLGVIEFGDKIAERTKASNEKITATIEKGKKVYEESAEIKDSIASFALGSSGQELLSNWRSGNVIGILNTLPAFRKELFSGFGNTYDRMKNTYSDVMDIFDGGKDLMSDPKGLGLSIAGMGTSAGIRYLLSRHILAMIRAELGQNAQYYRIRQMEISMGENGLLYAEKEAKLDRLLTVTVKYKVGIPLFIAPEIELERTVHKTVRAWIGE